MGITLCHPDRFFLNEKEFQKSNSKSNILNYRIDKRYIIRPFHYLRGFSLIIKNLINKFIFVWLNNKMGKIWVRFMGNMDKYD